MFIGPLALSFTLKDRLQAIVMLVMLLNAALTIRASTMILSLEVLYGT